MYLCAVEDIAKSSSQFLHTQKRVENKKKKKTTERTFAHAQVSSDRSPKWKKWLLTLCALYDFCSSLAIAPAATNNNGKVQHTT